MTFCGSTRVLRLVQKYIQCDTIMFGHTTTDSLLTLLCSNCISRWKEKEVPLANLRPSHVLQYSLNQLMTVVSAHCHYSLRTGQEKAETMYDFHALQRHLLNEFVYGKPLISMKKMPQMVYRKEVYTAEKFAEIMHKVHPQVIQCAGCTI